MTHNKSSGVSRGAVGRRLALALVGGLAYAHGLRPYLPVGDETTVAVGMAGAALVAGASYALVAGLSLEGRHRRPNAEVVLVVGLFGLLVVLQAAATPGLGGELSAPAVAALVAATLLSVLASLAYLARPELLRPGT